MSGLAISRGRLLTLVQKDGQQWLIARQAADGRAAVGDAAGFGVRNEMGNGPRATPTIAGERVLAFTGEGILAAVNFATASCSGRTTCPKS